MVTEVPMTQESKVGHELISTALPGISVILVLGPSLFIPAILMGDWMAEARQEREPPLGISPWLLPKDRPGPAIAASIAAAPPPGVPVASAEPGAAPAPPALGALRHPQCLGRRSGATLGRPGAGAPPL
eukprot:Skav215033  [mRNA]  locus=scaffold966:651235:653923:- [translate_table: standard]